MSDNDKTPIDYGDKAIPVCALHDKRDEESAEFRTDIHITKKRVTYSLWVSSIGLALIIAIFVLHFIPQAPIGFAIFP
jgi:uncharacterized integral membrane protein